MKKYLFLLFVVAVNIYAKYDFPLKDSYLSSIVGSSTMMLSEEISEKIPYKEYVIRKNKSDIPKNMWFENGYRFSFSKQKGPAPLIFLLSGTGAKYNSSKTKNFARILYDSGYHVVSVSSAFTSNFILNVSSTKTPGLLMQDGMDMYAVMEEMLEDIKKKEKPQITDTFLMGYSLGATHSAVISYIDSTKKSFNFKRVFLINPAINLHSSTVVLDKFVKNNIESREDIINIIEGLMLRVGNTLDPGDLSITMETIAPLFKNKVFSEEEMELLIGLAFNIVVLDINYLVDQLNGSNLYSDKSPEKYTEMYSYFEKLNFANFDDYLRKLVYPYYAKRSKKNLSFDQVIKNGDLKIIENYLKNEKKIAVVTNEDDFILSEKDINFVRNTFKERSLIYPYGGHCGNMFYQTNVTKMLEFLNKGVLNREL